MVILILTKTGSWNSTVRIENGTARAADTTAIQAMRFSSSKPARTAMTDEAANTPEAQIRASFLGTSFRAEQAKKVRPKATTGP